MTYTHTHTALCAYIAYHVQAEDCRQAVTLVRTWCSMIL